MPDNRPRPDELRTLLTDPGIRQYDDLLQPVPWLTWVDPTGVGLRSCIAEMLTANIPGTALDDPWGGGWTNKKSSPLRRGKPAELFVSGEAIASSPRRRE